MITRTVFINQHKINLDPGHLIQAGGEGMVFSSNHLGNGTAIKLYHSPTPQRITKLRQLLKTGFSSQLPVEVLGPTNQVTDQNGAIIGFQMPRLPAGSLPIKKLSNPLFLQKNNLQICEVVTLFQRIHTTLTHLHKLGVIIGDLNDHNLFFTVQASLITHHAFIDVDSYQFGHYPCPVAMQTFLDPELYHVTDFGERPYFTQNTDWYAFTVLLVKSLLHVHPYGGTHNQYKTLMARATAKMSILNTAVTYPQSARSLDVLSAEWNQQIHQIFERGQRHPFPKQLLASQHFNHSPGNISAPTSKIHPPHSSKLLLLVDGVIHNATVMGNGRIHVIVHENGLYKLVRLGLGGKLDELILFEGQPGYRFGIFGNFLAVNPPHGCQLLILDVGQGQPAKVTLLETALFQETAVFTTTNHHLYRIAGTWIMRGSMQNGLYVEDAIATAHRHQTQFWSSRYTETVAGYHRIFAENRFFFIHNGANYDIDIPQLAQGESMAETAVIFTTNTVTIQRTIRYKGQLRSESHTFDLKGHIQPTPSHLPPATDLAHPSGLIRCEPNRLIFLAK